MTKADAWSDNLVVLIPARGGSKGIENKNLCLVGSRTLLDRAIDCAFSLTAKCNIFVSSDDHQILEVAQARSVVPLERSLEASSDTATANSVLEEFCGKLDQSRVRDNPTIAYLQPTSPFRTGKDVNEAMRLFNENLREGTSLISVCQADCAPQKMYRSNSNLNLEPLLSPNDQFKNRQDLPLYFNANGAIYIFKMACFLRGKVIPTKRIIPFVMTKENSLDIDDPVDLKFANFIEKCR